jgi:hypothetical protein
VPILEHLQRAVHSSFGWSNTPKWCKSGFEYTTLLQDIEVSRVMGNKKKTASSWVFAFTVHTLAATDWLVALNWPTCECYMIPRCLKFGTWSSWVEREILLIQLLDVKTWPFSSEPLEMLLPATSPQFLHMGKLMMCLWWLYLLYVGCEKYYFRVHIHWAPLKML